MVCDHKALPFAPGFGYNSLACRPPVCVLHAQAGRVSSTRFTRRARSRGRGSVLRGARRIKAYSFGATMDILLAKKLLNSAGLAMDIVGAILVANEVVRRFRGIRITVGQSWSTMTDPPQETEEFQSWSRRTFRIMRLGLISLVAGFILQALSNWVEEIQCLLGFRL